MQTDSTTDDDLAEELIQENDDDASGEQVEVVEAKDADAQLEEAASESADTDDGISVSIGDEEAEASEDENKRAAPEWVRDLRKSNREKDRRIRELEQQVSKGAQTPAAVVVGEKPKLVEFASSEEIAEYEAKLESWHDRKRQADEQQRQRAQAEEQERTHWQGRLDAVSKAASALKAPDHDDAAMTFEDTFSVVQQGIIMSGPKDPQQSALLRYALGTNQRLAKELSSITNPVQFAWAAAEMGTKMKVTARKSVPAPERRVSGGGSSAAHVVADAAIAKLEAEARRTGDFTKVFEAKRKQRDRAKA